MNKEKSASEILVAQLDVEIAELKRSYLGTEFSTLADTLQTLIEKILTRWWVSRINKQPQPTSTKQMQERTANRMAVLRKCVDTIIERSGPIDLNALQMSALGMSAELNSLWGLLIELGLITPEGRQDYLDAGVENTYTRIMEYARQITLANKVPDGRRKSSGH